MNSIDYIGREMLYHIEKGRKEKCLIDLQAESADILKGKCKNNTKSNIVLPWVSWR